MTGVSQPAPALSWRATRLARPLWLTLAGALPLVAVAFVLAGVLTGETDVVDFRSFYVAAQALLRGDSPYPDYVYPPLTALATMPLALLPYAVAKVLVMLGLAAVVVATLVVLRVRDWRCYGVAFLWPPVLSAIQTGNVTLLLGFGAALAWRFRDDSRWSAVSIGVTLAAKLFLWPLAIWLAATRRYLGAVAACAAGAGILLASWAAIGFAGLGEYGGIVRRVQDVVEADSYTAHVVALDVGLGPGAARAIWLGLALAVAAGVVVLGRRGDDRGAFVLAVAAALAFSPIVWLHYFALLLVALAVAHPRLGVVWLVPLALFLTPGSGSPTPFQTAWTLAVVAAAFALALRSPRPDRTRVEPAASSGS